MKYLKTKPEKEIVVCVSGGMDPVHVGHVRMFEAARRLGTKLVVILNNDNWLVKKKGYTFMSEDERKEIIEALNAVDKVILTSHGRRKRDPSDMSICEELKKIKPHIFANGGDRWAGNIPEKKLCEQMGIELVDNVGGNKVQSSSDLVKRFGDHS